MTSTRPSMVNGHHYSYTCVRFLEAIMPTRLSGRQVPTATVTTIYHFLFLLYAVGNAIDEQLRFEQRCDQLRSRVSEPVMNRASPPKGSSPSTPVGTRCECISCRYRRVCNSPGWALQIRGVSCRHVPSPTHHHLLSPFRCGLRLCVAWTSPHSLLFMWIDSLVCHTFCVRLEA